MLGAFLDKLNGFFDQRFVIAYWSPVFIGYGLTVGLIGILLGPSIVLGWWMRLNWTEQIVLGVGILLLITVLAYLLQALSIPLVRLFEGYWPKGQLSNWACTLQKSRRTKTSDSARYHNFPRGSDLVKPTRLGNVLVTAEEYPHQVYQLDAVLWWPRLATLLPETFRVQVDTALTPMLTLLNLCMVLILLAFGGAIAVLLAHQPWWLFVSILFVGIILARACYVAAVSQAVDYGELVRVAFDLYRHDILKQMHIPLPDNLFEERLLWDLLNKWLYSYVPPWELVPGNNKPPLPDNPFYNDTHHVPTISVQP